MLGKHLHKFLTVASLLGALNLAGCPGPMPMPDGGVDMAIPGDMATQPDMTCDPASGGCPPVDMAKPGDMAMGDMAKPGDMAMGDMAKPSDMAMPPGDMAGRDMATPMFDMTRPGDMSMMVMGAVGSPCTDDMQCTGGPAPKCWKANVLNNAMNPATPGGYCSSTCMTDAQCGGGARCVDFGPGGKNCLAGCSNATTCRKPSYACRFNEGAGVCFPDSVFDCDPSTTGACTETGTGKMGGCMRGAYENKGTCVAGCTIGAGTCAAGPSGAKRQCVYVDTTVGTYKDKWKGATCLNSPATAVMPGGACSYSDDCTDGYQCDGASGTCKQLCVSGGMPACGMGMCSDAFKTMPASSPGMCR